MRKRPVVERFWEKVNKNGRHMPHMETQCWEWTAGTRNGYGNIKVGSHMLTAHRVSWLIHNGSIPDLVAPDDYFGTCVLHKCDNRLCVRPDHLFLGTQLDNIQDRARKGRTVVPVGVNNWNSKLDPDRVRQIRRLYASGEHSLKKLARQFAVSKKAVLNIVKRRVWREVEA